MWPSRLALILSVPIRGASRERLEWSQKPGRYLWISHVDLVWVFQQARIFLRQIANVLAWLADWLASIEHRARRRGNQSRDDAQHR